MGRRSKPDRAPIDHDRVTDSFGELRTQPHYEGFESRCGRCGAPFWFTAASQKYVHEERGVPIKRARSAGFCQACTRAAGRTRQTEAKRAGLLRAAEEAKRASAARPNDGGLLLEYVVAKLRVLEQDWSTRSAERLLGDVRRVARLDAKLSKRAAQREAQLRALLERH